MKRNLGAMGWLGLSLFFHIALVAGLIVWEYSWLARDGVQPPARPQSMEVRAVTEKDLQKRLAKALDPSAPSPQQLVQNDTEQESKESREDAKYLSKKNLMVDAETRAARVGKFKNVMSEGSEDDSVKKFFKLTPNEKDMEQAQAMESKTGRLRSPASLPPSGQRGSGFSATDDYLPDVAIGAQTLLNAKEYKFFGFFERIREKLTNRWHQKLDIEFTNLLAQGRAATGGDMVTQVKVLLDSRGQLKRVQIVGSSGHHELDRAATLAFHEAAPFPNPPAEMLDSDKTVTVRWDFVVLASAQGGVQVRVKNYGP